MLKCLNELREPSVPALLLPNASTGSEELLLPLTAF